MLRRHLIYTLLAGFSLVATAQEKVDLNTIYLIKQEAIQNGQVMDHAWWLTDAIGPRLTSSPGYKASTEWVIKTLKGWGIDARTEKWGSFGKSWRNLRFAAHLIEPSYQPIIGFAMPWTPSTEGAVTGEPVYAPIRTESDMARWKGKLKGKIVLTAPMRDLQPIATPMLSRYDDKQLAEMELAPDMVVRPPSPDSDRARMMAQMMGPQANFMQMRAFRNKLLQFWREEGPALLIDFGYRNDGGTMANTTGGSRDPKDPPAPPMVTITPEHYNRIARLLDKKVPVKVEFEVRNEMGDAAEDGVNVIAEIPGTGKHKDEIVMIGGHLDSWHASTGATDNAAGSAVMMEVLRVIKKLNLKLDRTVRMGLWSGEEQGLLGSRGYVKERFADRTTMQATKDYDKFSAYYNIDNGTGRIRGIYLQGNDMCRPIFESWLAPFRDLGVTTVTSRNTSGTDHQAFDAVGLPGFQFIQDPIEYSTRTHHSNMDVYDRLQSADMKQMAAIVTSLVYHTANREEKLPRKPKPAPQPEGSGRPF
jgi:hypothetical protein